MRAIKENLLLVTGLFLPFLLIGIFYVSTLLPGANLPPPQYDFLFTIGNFQQKEESSTNYYIKDGRLMITAIQPDNKAVARHDDEQLFRYSAENQAVSAISHDIARGMKNLQIDVSPLSPDGYIYTNGRDMYRSGVIDLFFGYHHNYNTHYLQKGQTRHQVVFPHGREYQFYNIDFLGWITKDGEPDE